MDKLQTYLQMIYEKFQIESGAQRRFQMIQSMQALQEKQINCFQCSGLCCTKSANSMQITPLEALEILFSLNPSKSELQPLKMRLKKTIQDFRLEHEVFTGKKVNALMRKTYTCPFFIEGSKGCTIKKDLKPYGCLGFNPKKINDNGQECQSDQMLLLNRDSHFSQKESILNDFLKNAWELSWDKQEIPRAVLSVLEKMENEF